MLDVLKIKFGIAKKLYLLNALLVTLVAIYFIFFTENKVIGVVSQLFLLPTIFFITLSFSPFLKYRSILYSLPIKRKILVKADYLEFFLLILLGIILSFTFLSIGSGIKEAFFMTSFCSFLVIISGTLFLILYYLTKSGLKALDIIFFSAVLVYNFKIGRGYLKPEMFDPIFLPIYAFGFMFLGYLLSLKLVKRWVL